MAVLAIPGQGLAGSYGPSSDVACSGVTLRPGADIQQAVRSNPAGTTFCLSAGIYARQAIEPKAGDRFIGQMGAVLDGDRHTRRAFDGDAPDVLIQNLVITRYAAPAQDAAVHADGGSNWVVTQSEISYNEGRGVDLGDRIRVTRNYIHHNRQLGLGGTGAHVVVDSNDISFNNFTDAYDSWWEAGGTKFWATTDAAVTNNYVHDNHGPGLWADNDNIRMVYRHNWVENNRGAGIFHEISYDATIVENVIKTNGHTSYCPGWLWCAGIQIAGSGGTDGGRIEIAGNLVVAAGSEKGNGIALIQQPRGAGAYGPHLVRNVHVHDNIVDMSGGGATGAVEDTSDPSIFEGRNNVFESNTYYVGASADRVSGGNGQSQRGPDAFAWDGSVGSFTRWQGFGLDRRGTTLTGSIGSLLVGEPNGWEMDDLRRKLRR